MGRPRTVTTRCSVRSGVEQGDSRRAPGLPSLGPGRYRFTWTRYLVEARHWHRDADAGLPGAIHRGHATRTTTDGRTASVERRLIRRAFARDDFPVRLRHLLRVRPGRRRCAASTAAHHTMSRHSSSSTPRTTCQRRARSSSKRGRSLAQGTATVRWSAAPRPGLRVSWCRTLGTPLATTQTSGGARQTGIEQVARGRRVTCPCSASLIPGDGRTTPAPGRQPDRSESHRARGRPRTTRADASPPVEAWRGENRGHDPDRRPRRLDRGAPDVRRPLALAGGPGADGRPGAAGQPAGGGGVGLAADDQLAPGPAARRPGS